MNLSSRELIKTKILKTIKKSTERRQFNTLYFNDYLDDLLLEIEYIIIANHKEE